MGHVRNLKLHIGRKIPHYISGQRFLPAVEITKTVIVTLSLRRNDDSEALSTFFYGIIKMVNVHDHTHCIHLRQVQHGENDPH